MLIWCILGLIGLGRGMAMTIVQEVPLGEMAILRCPSNDDNHRFQFWELSTKDIIGPGNNLDKQKYKYEVLTGTLYIKGVSTQERGIYTCISKHLDNPSMSAKSVELVVRQNWETVYEEDSSTNLLRVLVVVLSIALILILAFIVYTLKRDRLSQFRDFIDEESGGTPSPDDISGIAGSYKSTVAPLRPPPPPPPPARSPVPARGSSIVIGGFDSSPAMTFDTDFPREFTSVSMAHESKM
ncbi:hypothetical protein WDU94_011256 [Cyamophila willieti]